MIMVVRVVVKTDIVPCLHRYESQAYSHMSGTIIYSKLKYSPFEFRVRR